MGQLCRIGFAAAVLACGLQGCAAESAPVEANSTEAHSDELYVLAPNVWNDRSISVCWEAPPAGGDRYDLQRQQVEEAVRLTWEAYSQVNFTFSDCGTRGANIRIRWIDSAVDTPKVVALGSALNNVPNGMLLNPTYQNWNTSCAGPTRRACIMGTAVHEFGHALGFAHEHLRPDTPESCTAVKNGTLGDTTTGQYDANSIMNYCRPPHLGYQLSDGDKVGLQRFYGPSKPSSWRQRIVLGRGRGLWTPFEYCPGVSFGSAYKIRVEAGQGSGDDTAMNAVSLTCSNVEGAKTGTLVPHGGYWGSWSGVSACPPGQFINAADLRVESNQGSGDDTGANDLHVSCTNTNDARLTTGEGGPYGAFAGMTYCPAGTAVCGLSVQVLGPQGSGDDSAMGGMQIDCCKIPSSSGL